MRLHAWVWIAVSGVLPAQVGPGLSAPFAPSTFFELAIGVYTPAVPGNPAPATYTATADAAALSTSAGDRAIQFDSTATIAVFERIRRQAGPTGTITTVFDHVYVTARAHQAAAPDPRALRHGLKPGVRGRRGRHPPRSCERSLPCV